MKVKNEIYVIYTATFMSPRELPLVYFDINFDISILTQVTQFIKTVCCFIGRGIHVIYTYLKTTYIHNRSSKHRLG